MNPNRPASPQKPLPVRNESRTADRNLKRRIVFSPEGDVEVQFRESNPNRPARPGRQERDAIRRGERPFFNRRENPRTPGEAPSRPWKQPTGWVDGTSAFPGSGEPSSGPSGQSTQRSDRFGSDRRGPSGAPEFNRPLYAGSRTWRPPGADDKSGFNRESHSGSAPYSGSRTWRPPQARRNDGPSSEGERPLYPGSRTWRPPAAGGTPGGPDTASHRPITSSAPRYEGGLAYRGRSEDRRDNRSGGGAPRFTTGRSHGAAVRGWERPDVGMSPTLGGPVRPFRGSFRKPEPPPAPVSVTGLAAEVIQRANRELPADAALRAVLKNARGLSPVEAEAISTAVFQHYRWFGWLDAEGPVEARLEHAAELAARFEREPGSFSSADLRSQTVPDWTWLQVEAPEDWARTLQQTPRLWLRSHPAYEATLQTRLPVRPGPLPGSFQFEGSEDLFVHPAFQAGEFEIQDISSQAVSLVCEPKPTETWWDACAGEGGKTLHLSTLMGGKGMIWASDRATWRLERLRRRTARAHCFNYRAAIWDGSDKLPTRTEFDGVLVDAPCSGLGTWGRNPHARWTTTPADVQELSAVQRQLLTHVRGSLRPNGRLIYAVCTLTRSETAEVADWFTQTFAAEFDPLPLQNPLSPTQPPSAQLTLWPSETGGNGMFIAGWRRKPVTATPL